MEINVNELDILFEDQRKRFMDSLHSNLQDLESKDDTKLIYIASGKIQGLDELEVSIKSFIDKKNEEMT